MTPEEPPDKLILTEDAHACPPKSMPTQMEARTVAVQGTDLILAMQTQSMHMLPVKSTCCAPQQDSAEFHAFKCLPFLAPISHALLIRDSMKSSGDPFVWLDKGCAFSALWDCFGDIARP